MRSKNKVILIVALISLVFVSLLLGGCGSNDQKAQEQKSAGSSKQEPYPTKPLTFIVPVAPGGGNDVIARLLAKIIQPTFGQPVVVVNKPGGSQNIGLTETANAAPDGYTICITAANISTNYPMGISKLTHENFATIAAVAADSGAIWVRKDAPWKTIDDFIKDAKAKPGQIKIGVGAQGSAWYCGLVKLEEEAGIDLNIVAGSAGTATILPQLLGGHIDAIFLPPFDVIGQVKSGEIRPLAFSSEKRVAAFPDVPTLKEKGFNVNITCLRIILAPKDTPAYIVEKLQDIFKKATEDKQFIDFMQENLSQVMYMNSQELRKFLVDELKFYTDIIEKAGLRNKKE